MKLEELNPFVRYANFYTFYEDTNENRACYDCRLFYILSGDGHLTVNGENHSFSNNSLIYLPPRSRYKFFFKKSHYAKIYIFDFDLCHSFAYLTASLNTARESTFDPKRSPEYELLPELKDVIVKDNMISVFPEISTAVECFFSKESYYSAVVSAKVKLCLVSLITQNENSEPKNTLISSVKEFIKSHYMNSELNNSEIANHFNYHSYYLNRLMKEKTGETLHDFLLSYRIERAKNLLITTEMSISIVADKTGFASYSYFISRFHRKVGISPRQYRIMHKNMDF